MRMIQSGMALLLVCACALAGTTQPATPPAPEVLSWDKLLQEIPADLRQTRGESPKVRRDRNKWIMQRAGGKKVQIWLMVSNQRLLPDDSVHLGGIGKGPIIVEATFRDDPKAHKEDRVTFVGKLSGIDDRLGDMSFFKFEDCVLSKVESKN